MSKLLIANWKSNPETSAEARKLARAEDAADVVIAPSFTFIETVKGVISNAELGAQDTFWSGDAYTGEVSASQLKKMGVKYAIVGHSERRRYLAETDELINKKVKAALKAGLKVILCVGEPKRELGSKNYELRRAQKYVKRQLEKDLKGIHNSLIIAYEPVWAIGAGYSDTPEDAAEMIIFIKDVLKSKFKIQNSKVLYGGSVTAKNVTRFLSLPEISGALVGGASLNAREFGRIIQLVGDAKRPPGARLTRMAAPRAARLRPTFAKGLGGQAKRKTLL